MLDGMLGFGLLAERFKEDERANLQWLENAGLIDLVIGGWMSEGEASAVARSFSKEGIEGIVRKHRQIAEEAPWARAWEEIAERYPASYAVAKRESLPKIEELREKISGQKDNEQRTKFNRLIGRLQRAEEIYTRHFQREEPRPNTALPRLLLEQLPLQSSGSTHSSLSTESTKPELKTLDREVKDRNPHIYIECTKPYDWYRFVIRVPESFLTESEREKIHSHKRKTAPGEVIFCGRSGFGETEPSFVYEIEPGRKLREPLNKILPGFFTSTKRQLRIQRPTKGKYSTPEEIVSPYVVGQMDYFLREVSEGDDEAIMEGLLGLEELVRKYNIGDYDERLTNLPQIRIKFSLHEMVHKHGQYATGLFLVKKNNDPLILLNEEEHRESEDHRFSYETVRDTLLHELYHFLEACEKKKCATKVGLDKEFGRDGWVKSRLTIDEADILAALTITEKPEVAEMYRSAITYLSENTREGVTIKFNPRTGNFQKLE